MKKFILPATLVAMMGVGAYFGHATAAPTEGLSDLELANAEALADPEWWIEIDWADGCEAGTDWCVRGPQEVHRNAKSFKNPPAE